MPVVTRGPPTPLAKQSQRVGEVPAKICPSFISSALVSALRQTTRSSKLMVSKLLALLSVLLRHADELEDVHGETQRTRLRGLDVRGEQGEDSLVRHDAPGCPRSTLARFGLRSATMSCWAASPSVARRIDWVGVLGQLPEHAREALDLAGDLVGLHEEDTDDDVGQHGHDLGG